MKHCLIFLLLSLFFSSIHAQRENKFSLEINYGINGNFFVRSYIESAPPPAKQFYKKNFIGSSRGFEFKYSLNAKSSIGIGLTKSLNKKEINYTLGNNSAIRHFNITHTNIFNTLFFENSISKKNNNLRWLGGIYYLRMKQQEIDASPIGIYAEERDYKNNKLEEGGVFAGVHFYKRIDTKFDLGIKTSIYYTISTISFEAILLTPTLTYHF